MATGRRRSSDVIFRCGIGGATELVSENLYGRLHEYSLSSQQMANSTAFARLAGHLKRGREVCDHPCRIIARSASHRPVRRHAAVR